MSVEEATNGDDISRDTNKDAYEPKEKPKIIRVLTVFAYILSVSMAAILLSIYYVFVWDGHPHLGSRIQDKFSIDASQDSNVNSPSTKTFIMNTTSGNFFFSKLP